MSSPRRATEPPVSLAEIGARVERRIADLLDKERERWAAVDPALEAPLASLERFVAAGGKRLRPAFCHWAYVGAGGDPHDPVVGDAGAALELLHTFALIHDDVMDGSDERRGLRAVHRQFVDLHEQQSWRGEARRFGEGAAILVGDFAFVYADVLFGSAASAARPVYDELRVELCVGQYLDLHGSAVGGHDSEQARRIHRYKSGKYTVERPLHLGVALNGRLDDLGGPLTRFGLPLGEAFQLRDDLLGVFGDREVTGKPVGDDLREGKLTPLVTAAHSRATGAGAGLLDRMGAPDLSDAEVEAIQQVLVECGAVAEIEATIDHLVDDAMAALAAIPLAEPARAELEALGVYVAWRDR
jgi:geranylgeranyl diphosphate synthase, type I